MIIAVIGGGNASSEARRQAEEVGRELARRGITVVCGGLGGVMEAVCYGAKAEGGVTIGILPGSSPSAANPYVDYPICTGMSYARNVIIVKTGQAVIAIDGAYGTLSEIGHALGEEIPVIGLGTWNLSVNSSQDDSIIVATDPVDAVQKALEAAGRRVKRTNGPVQ